jgi:hypothetical protein
LLALAALQASLQAKSRLDLLSDSDWESISACLPGRTGEDCFYKFLSFYKWPIKDYPWTESEDSILEVIVSNPASTDWTLASKELYKANPDPRKVYRSGKQCREHFYCNLAEGLRKGAWTKR